MTWLNTAYSTAPSPYVTFDQGGNVWEWPSWQRVESKTRRRKLWLRTLTRSCQLTWCQAAMARIVLVVFGSGLVRLLWSARVPDLEAVQPGCAYYMSVCHPIPQKDSSWMLKREILRCIMLRSLGLCCLPGVRPRCRQVVSQYLKFRRGEHHE